MDSDHITAAWLEGLGFRVDEDGDWFRELNYTHWVALRLAQGPFDTTSDLWVVKIRFETGKLDANFKSRKKLLAVARALGVENF